MQRCGSGGNRCRDVAVEGTGAETKTSDQEWKEQEAQVCSRCGHSQRWSNVHVVEAVLLLKECVVGRTVETVTWWEVARPVSSTT